MGSRSQWQAHLLAQSIHQRYQKSLERQSPGVNGDHKRYLLMACHYLLVWMQQNRSPRLRLIVQLRAGANGYSRLSLRT